jgi:uncharacterized protein (TIGR02246 family)
MLKENKMKSIILLCLRTVFFSFDGWGQNSDVETIKKLNQDWLNSFPTRDSGTLSKILADDFILVGANGTKQTKTDNLLNMVSPNIEFKSVNIDSVDVQLITADVGVLTAWTSFIFKADGKEMKGSNCYQDVYMKRKNRWHAVSAHVTLLGMH